LDFLGYDEYWESHTDGLQILRYQNNQAYTPHADYLAASRDENHNYKSNGVGTNRYATILLYMSDLNESDGGETVFTEAWPEGTPPEAQLSKQQLLDNLRSSGVVEGILQRGSWEEEMYALGLEWSSSRISACSKAVAGEG
jgi:hypothetical protein